MSSTCTDAAEKSLFCLIFQLSVLFHDFVEVWDQGGRIRHGRVRTLEL